MNLQEAITFDDVLLKPQISTLNSRSEVSLETTVFNKLGEEFKFQTPIIPANMKNISGIEMLQVTHSLKGLGLLHRFMPFKEQLEHLKTISSWENGLNYIGFSIGIQDQDYYYAEELIKNGAKILCIDVANAACNKSRNLINYIANNHPNILLIAGTVGFGDGAGYLYWNGADIVRCGIGGGSICSTRLMTGCGSPMISAIHDCYQSKLYYEQYFNRPLYLIADGGMKHPADVCKAIAIGADFTILGNMFSGSDEAPGEIKTINNVSYKKYVGSSTLKETNKEGVEAWVKLKGPAKNIFTTIMDGLRSCCSYQNAHNLFELKQNAKFIKVSPSVIKENGAHDLDIVEGHIK